MKFLVLLFVLLLSAPAFSKNVVYHCTANENPAAVVLTIDGTSTVTIEAMGKALTTKIVTKVDDTVAKYYEQRIAEVGISKDQHLQFYFTEETEYPADIVVNLSRPEHSWLLIPDDKVEFTCNVKN